MRRYVPELADLDDPALIHQPWRLGVDDLKARGYPEPMVEVAGGRVAKASASADADQAEPLF